MTVIYLSERIRREQRRMPGHRKPVPITRPSARMIAERDALFDMPRTVTAELMGDPLPGRSALDRR